MKHIIKISTFATFLQPYTGKKRFLFWKTTIWNSLPNSLKGTEGLNTNNTRRFFLFYKMKNRESNICLKISLLPITLDCLIADWNFMLYTLFSCVTLTLPR